MKHIIFLFIFGFVSPGLFADEVPANGMTDPRIKQVAYNPRDVITVTAHYGFSSLIEFASYEEIQTISLGDTLAWNLLPVKNMIFLKPVEDHADTNMQVITSHRVYNFALKAEKAKDHKDKDLTFSLLFRYPEDELKTAQLAKAAEDAKNAPHPSEITPEHSFNADAVNMEYTFRGSKDIAPRRVFDDGDFTYFYFNEKTETPAIFVVDGKDNESLVNFHNSGKYIVVQRLARKFVLRHGDSVTCIYNEHFLPELQQDIKMKRDTSPASEKESLPVKTEEGAAT